MSVQKIEKPINMKKLEETNTEGATQANQSVMTVNTPKASVK
jgi:hypothetical protein